MATTTKYRKSKAARDNGAKTVVLMNKGRTEAIDLDNMTDAQAERILASDQFKHNIEKVAKEETEPKKSPKNA